MSDADPIAAENAELRARLARLEALLAERQPSAAPAGFVEPKRAAYESGYSYETIRRWARLNVLRSAEIGGRLFVDSGHLAEILAARRL